MNRKFMTSTSGSLGCAERSTAVAGPGTAVSRKLKVKARVATMPGTVTVIIPCYNYARYLPDAVDSALSQDGVNVDVIVVDDKSTDDSQRVARKLAAIDGRITAIGHEKNT